MLTLYLAAILALSYILVRKYRNRYFSAKISQFDGPTLLKTYKACFSTRGSANECFRVGQEWMKRYDSCFAFTSLIDTYVCTGRREDVQLLFKLANKGRIYKFLQSSMGAGLVVTNGEKWKKHRAIMDSAFAVKELSTNLLLVFNEQSRALVDQIEEKGLGVEFGIWSLVMRTLTQTMLEITLGSRKAAELRAQDFGAGNRKAEKLIMKRVYTPWLYPDFMFKLYLLLTKQSGVFEAVRKPFLKAIQEKKLLRLKKGISASKTSPSPRTIILDILMKNDLTDEELTDQLMTLFFTGVETTTTAICFTLLMLAKNPDVQEKVVQELNSVFFDNKDGPIDVSDLAKLTFLEQCIKESLRKLSMVPFVERYVTRDVTLSDGRVVPAGANFILFIHGIHNNPEYYPNPEIWNPHNFDEERVAQRPIYAYIPFALGLRQCVGYKFAMMSIKVSVSTILRNFIVTTNQAAVTLDYYLLVRCTSGYPLKFVKR